MILSLIGFKLRLRIFRYTNDNNTINRVEAKNNHRVSKNRDSTNSIGL